MKTSLNILNMIEKGADNTLGLLLFALLCPVLFLAIAFYLMVDIKQRLVTPRKQKSPEAKRKNPSRENVLLASPRPF